MRNVGILAVLIGNGYVLKLVKEEVLIIPSQSYES